MKVEDIPADELVVMDSAMHRLFNAGGCDPTCHGCRVALAVGDRFKLATVTEKHIEKELSQALRVFRSTDPHEVMLCSECTPESMLKAARRVAKAAPHRYWGGHPGYGGCFRVNGKIVL